MQLLPLTFLSLIFAHLLADFPFQTEWIANNKGKRALPMLIHAAIHYLTALVCLSFFAGVPILSSFTQILIVSYVVVHVVIDAGKSRLLSTRMVSDNWVSFLLDQMVHVLVAVAVAVILSGSTLRELFGYLSMPPADRSRLLLIGTVYVSVVFGGGYLIRYFTRGLAQGIKVEGPNQLRNAGLYIGWIERFLVITAIAVQSPTMVGLILTGKSIARFPELKDARFAEYFLIGTLLSIALALSGGLVMVHAIYGTFALK